MSNNDLDLDVPQFVGGIVEETIGLAGIVIPFTSLFPDAPWFGKLTFVLCGVMFFLQGMCFLLMSSDKFPLSLHLRHISDWVVNNCRPDGI